MAELEAAAVEPDEDAEIEIPEDEVEIEGEEGDEEPEGEPEPEPEIVSAEDGIKEFKQRLAAEAEARKAAEARSAQLERSSIEQIQKHEIGQYHQVQHAIDAVTSKAKITQREHTEALRAGDYEKASELQASMAEEAVALAQLRQNKSQWEAYLANPNRHQRQAQPQQKQAPADQVEAMAQAVAQSGAPRSADWIRQHPEYARDPALTEKMQRAHYSAMGDGLQADTDAYFAHINKKLGIGKVTTDKKPVERRAQPAAPTSRSVPGAGPRNKMKMSREAVAMARDLDIPLPEYARYQAKLRKEGRLPPEKY